MACLAAAMTCTTALLGWLDPSARITAIVPDEQYLDDVAREAQYVVADNVAIDADRWVEIELTTKEASVSGGRLLVATTDSTPWHFLVDHNGRLTRGARWRDQRPAEKMPGKVLIQVSVFRENDPLAPSQWVGVRALVAGLNEALGTASTPLPVRLPPEHRRARGASRWLTTNPLARLAAFAD